MDDERTRRAFLCGAGAALGTSLAGCTAPATDASSRGRSMDDDSASSRMADGTTSGDRQTDGTAADGAAEEADALDERYAAVYRETVDSVVSIRARDETGLVPAASAFVYDDRHLVTNEHVVRNARRISVRFQETGWREGTLVASDVHSDLAVVRVPDRPNSAPPLPFVEEEPPIGTRVIAIGNPFGYAGSVSAGVVSGVDRTLPAANQFTIPDAVQTDAAVNPGSSGGPLVTLDGEVVGVINAGGGDNVGFAISAALTERVVPSLIRDGEYEHSYVGVAVTDVTPTIARANDLAVARGVYVDDVTDGGPADGVLQGSRTTREVDGVPVPVGGDVLLALDDTPVPTSQALSTFLALETRPGDALDVRIRRDGTERTVRLTLGSRPAG